MTPIQLSDVQSAAKNIADIACVTPLKKSINLCQKTQKNIYLKMETMQHTGAFKLRGAANVLKNLTDAHTVVTASSGNHGRAVAYVANELGMKVIVCVTTLVPENKIAAMQQLGAQVIVHGDNQDVTTVKAQQIAQEQQIPFISAFDDPDVIAGQGTIALEILQQRPEIDTIVTQLSGGGLAAGIAIAAKALKPSIKVIGVTIEQGAAMLESMRAGHIVEVEESLSIADALTGPIPPDNQYTFNICNELIDDVVQVSETQIKQAMVCALVDEKLVLEGGGAATIAMLMQREHDHLLGDNVAVVCSGDNVSIEKLMGYYQESLTDNL
jgi:threonine dehydratase